MDTSRPDQMADVVNLPVTPAAEEAHTTARGDLEVHLTPEKLQGVAAVSDRVRAAVERARAEDVDVSAFDRQAEFDAMVAERGESLAQIDAHVEAALKLVEGMSPAERKRTLMRARVDEDGVLRGPQLRPVSDD